MEVERKYFALCAPAELTARLGALGARVVSVDEFEDEYFDRPTPSLIASGGGRAGGRRPGSAGFRGASFGGADGAVPRAARHRSNADVTRGGAGASGTADSSESEPSGGTPPRP